jgi:hypothetical protein
MGISCSGMSGSFNFCSLTKCSTFMMRKLQMRIETMPVAVMVRK